MKQVLVACDISIAASTVVNDAVEEMAEGHNIKVGTKRVKITEVGPYENAADLLVAIAMTGKEYKFPVVNTRNFLTGIGVEETK